MTNTKTLLAVTIAIAAAVALGFSLVSTGQASPGSLKKDEIEKIIHDYIMENPELVADALDAHAINEEMREAALAEENLAVLMPELLTSEDGYAIGASEEDAKVVVVELFDYHCGYCKDAGLVMSQLVEEDDDLRVILRELPILREESRLAAEMALSARDQDKYQAFHFALMGASGLLDAARIETIARETGIDVAKMQSVHDAADYSDLLMRTREIAIDLGITGTPSFIITAPGTDYRQLIGGWDEKGLKAAIEEARSQNR